MQLTISSYIEKGGVFGTEGFEDYNSCLNSCEVSVWNRNGKILTIEYDDWDLELVFNSENKFEGEQIALQSDSNFTLKKDKVLNNPIKIFDLTIFQDKIETIFQDKIEFVIFLKNGIHLHLLEKSMDELYLSKILHPKPNDPYSKRAITALLKTFKIIYLRES